MPSSNIYLVPIDFSRGSERALNYALKMARETKGKIIVLNVIPADGIYAPAPGKFDLAALFERDARESFKMFAKRNRLKPKDCAFVVARGTNFAETIARQAKKLHATMIVMGSHGRTGFQRFVLGSVAEKTLRYANCPVLVVK